MLVNLIKDRVIDINPLFPIPRTSREAQTLSQRIAYLLSNIHEQLPDSEAVLAQVDRDLPSTLISAFNDEEPIALLEVHKTLFQIYETSLSHPLSPICLHEHSPWLMTIRNAIEIAWLNYELPRLQYHLPNESEAKNPQLLCDWFVKQAYSESGTDRAVSNFFKNQASTEEFNLFILSDAILNYRFCDALALAQLHFSETVKAEIVSNMFDECGHGVADKSHSRQFSEMLTDLGLQQPTPDIWGNDWRPYAGHNLYFFLGLSRKHYFKSIGSLAMPEIFDPNRDRAVVAGLERLYGGKVNYHFYASHIDTDELHGLRWLEKAIAPIVEVQPFVGMELAIGGAIRMEAMRRYNEYLAVRFGLLSLV